jgi:hypothetical protein
MSVDAEKATWSKSLRGISASLQRLYSSDTMEIAPEPISATGFKIATGALLQKAGELAIDKYKARYLAAQFSYKRFKEKHGLDVDPRYEISPTFAFGLLALMSIGESSATAFLLQLKKGLLNALYLALSLSLVNILAGFFIGYFLLRYMHHQKLFNRIWAWTLFVPVSLLGVWYNLAIGVYRERLLSSPYNSNAAQDFLQAALSIVAKIDELRRQGTTAAGLESASLVLIVIGIAVFILSITKGFFHEHPYPDYKKNFESLLWAEDEYFTRASVIYEESARLIDRLKADEAHYSNPASRTPTIVDLIDWHRKEVRNAVSVPLYNPKTKSTD